MNYQPKGGMCAACIKKEADCSGLPFSDMRVISSDLETAIVVCSEFDNETHWKCYAKPAKLNGKTCGYENTTVNMNKRGIIYCDSCGCSKYASDSRRDNKLREAE